MEWTQVLTIIAVNIALFLWVRSEGNTYRRELRNVLDEMKRK